MIDALSLGDMERQFQDVHDMMCAVRQRNQKYTFEKGRLTVFVPGHVLVVESVGCILMYSLVYKKNWDKLQVIIAEYSLTDKDIPSLVGFMNANNWNVPLDLKPLYQTYSMVVCNAECLMYSKINIDALVPATKEEPTTFGVILYALVGVANFLEDDEQGVDNVTTIYGIFNNLDSLRRAIQSLPNRIANAEDTNIRKARHEFAVHPFAINECFGLGTDVSMNFYTP